MPGTEVMSFSPARCCGFEEACADSLFTIPGWAGLMAVIRDSMISSFAIPQSFYFRKIYNRV